MSWGYLHQLMSEIGALPDMDEAAGFANQSLQILAFPDGTGWYWKPGTVRLHPGPAGATPAHIADAFMLRV